MPKRKTSFNPEWSKEHGFIAKSRKDDFHAFCTLCQCDMEISSKGKGAIERHAASDKHKLNTQNALTSSLSSYLQVVWSPQDDGADVAPVLSLEADSCNAEADNIKEEEEDRVFIKEEVCVKEEDRVLQSLGIENVDSSSCTSSTLGEKLEMQEMIVGENVANPRRALRKTNLELASLANGINVENPETYPEYMMPSGNTAECLLSSSNVAPETFFKTKYGEAMDGPVAMETREDEMRKKSETSFKILQMECLRLEKQKLSLEIRKLQNESDLSKQRFSLELDKLKAEKEKVEVEKEYLKLKMKKLKMDME